MTERALLAQEFVMCFQTLRKTQGDRALLDPSVQAARCRYLHACTAPTWRIAA